MNKGFKQFKVVQACFSESKLVLPNPSLFFRMQACFSESKRVFPIPSVFFRFQACFSSIRCFLDMFTFVLPDRKHMENGRTNKILVITYICRWVQHHSTLHSLGKFALLDQTVHIHHYICKSACYRWYLQSNG